MLCGFVRLSIMHADELKKKQVRPVPLPAIGPAPEKQVEFLASRYEMITSQPMVD